MKLMLDSANIKEIEQAIELGIIDSITTNPTILKRESQSRKESLRQLSKYTDLKLFVQVTGITADKMYEDFLEIDRILMGSKLNYVIKVPINNEGLKVIKRIKAYKDIEILGTAIYDTLQAITAIEAGCEYLAPYYNRIETLGHDASEEINSIRTYIDNNRYNTVIVAASFKTVQQIKTALLAGAHTCTISYELLEALATRPKVELDIQRFEEDHLEVN